MDQLSNQLPFGPMGVTMSREEDNYPDQPSIDAELRAVEISNVSYYVCTLVVLIG